MRGVGQSERELQKSEDDEKRNLMGHGADWWMTVLSSLLVGREGRDCADESRRESAKWIVAGLRAHKQNGKGDGEKWATNALALGEARHGRIYMQTRHKTSTLWAEG